MSLISEIKFMYVCIKEVFESLEKVDEPTLQLVVPSYYLLQRKFAAGLRDCNVIQVFRSHLRKYLDQKFWSSITAFHWMSTFMDPSFKHFDFIPNATPADARFKRNLMKDIDDWMVTEMKVVADKLAERCETEPPRLAYRSYIFCTFYLAIVGKPSI